jgi:hypothetical protein
MQSTYKNGRKGILKRRTVLLIVLFTVSAVLGHAKDESVVYREFRYRIERNSGKSSQSQPSVALLSKKTGIILESRAVNSNNGTGRGGWRQEKRITLADPNDRDL